MKPLCHPDLPRPNANHADRQLYRLAAQMFVLENSRPKAFHGVATDMDSKAVLWRYCQQEWMAAADVAEKTDRPW